MQIDTCEGGTQALACLGVLLLQDVAVVPLLVLLPIIESPTRAQSARKPNTTRTNANLRRDHLYRLRVGLSLSLSDERERARVPPRSFSTRLAR